MSWAHAPVGDMSVHICPCHCHVAHARACVSGGVLHIMCACDMCHRDMHFGDTAARPMHACQWGLSPQHVCDVPLHLWKHEHFPVGPQYMCMCVTFAVYTHTCDMCRAHVHVCAMSVHMAMSLPCLQSTSICVMCPGHFPPCVAGIFPGDEWPLLPGGYFKFYLLIIRVITLTIFRVSKSGFLLRVLHD